MKSGLSRKTVAPLISAAVAAVVGAWLAPSLKERLANGSSELWRVLPGLVIYIGFGIYWDIAARKASSLAQSESRASSLLHQALIAAGLLLIILPVPGLLTRILPSTSTLLIAGLAIEAFGVGIAVWARQTLGKSWSREVGLTQDHRLVRTGPYSRVRHPIYTGALLIYVGLAIAIGRVHALAGLGLVCLAYWRKITMEERILADAYGSDFADYRRVSYALMPFVL